MSPDNNRPIRSSTSWCASSSYNLRDYAATLATEVKKWVYGSLCPVKIPEGFSF
jgi:hypothetical protein